MKDNKRNRSLPLLIYLLGLSNALNALAVSDLDKINGFTDPILYLLVSSILWFGIGLSVDYFLYKIWKKELKEEEL